MLASWPTGCPAQPSQEAGLRLAAWAPLCSSHNLSCRVAFPRQGSQFRQPRGRIVVNLAVPGQVHFGSVPAVTAAGSYLRETLFPGCQLTPREAQHRLAQLG